MTKGKGKVSVHRLSEHMSFPPGRWIDLSYEYCPSMVVWPTAEPFRLESAVRAGAAGDGWVRANRISAAEHCGTHVDAPLHTCEGGRAVDEIPLDRLIGPAVVVDVAERALRDRDHVIALGEMAEWEARHGAIPEEAIVLFHTGHGRHWREPARYLGTDRRGEDALAELHFPGLSSEAGAWLVQVRNVRAIAIDTPSIDCGRSRGTVQKFATHRAVLGRGVPIFENVANLDQLPATGAVVFALPMKIRGGSGAPARIVAWVPLPS